MSTDHNELLESIRSTLAAEENRDTALRQTVSLLKAGVAHYAWVGIYLLEPGGDMLGLHNFLGKPSPHTRIPVSEGICGAAVRERDTVIVDDVHSDPRYLACSLETRSEIVVPIQRGTDVYGEIDIDSDQAAAFTSADRVLLERVAELLVRFF